nr:DUF4435 domain-containing protein [Pseudomonas yamanorum]
MRLRSKKCPIFIIEGKDDPKFYTSKIAGVFGDFWEFISVGGKSKVLELRNQIRGNPQCVDDNVYFFIDKDFDDRELYRDLYTTPAYSIENLYCESSTIRRLLAGECGLSNYKVSRRDEIIDFVVAKYEQLRNDFHRSKKIIAMNAVFLFVRKKLASKKISLDKVFVLEVDVASGRLRAKLKRKALYFDIKSSERKGFYQFYREGDAWSSVSANPSAYFRGKQEILLLREFIRGLQAGRWLSDSIKLQFDQVIKLENPSMADHVLSTAAQYVSSPVCLTQFLFDVKRQVDSVKVAA